MRKTGPKTHICTFRRIGSDGVVGVPSRPSSISKLLFVCYVLIADSEKERLRLPAV